MDIQEEREAFQKFCEENFDFENHEQTYFDEQTQCYENDIGEDTESINMAWEAWQAAKAQAVPEWISVEGELPKRNLNVLLNLVVRKNGKPIKCIGFYSIEPDEEPCFVLDDNFTVLKGVTHWMMLPQPPKAQEQKG